MSEKTLLTLPDDSDTLARLIEAIPSDWSWVDGYLESSSELRESGRVARTAGYFISRFSINPLISGPWNHEKRARDRPDLCEILVERKLPLLIQFDEAGFQERTASLAVAKKVAAHHVRLGYRGWLGFSAGCYDNEKCQNPAYCQLGFAIGQTQSCVTNWRLEIDWNARYGGKPELVEPILAAARALGLQPPVEAA